MTKPPIRVIIYWQILEQGDFVYDEFYSEEDKTQESDFIPDDDWLNDYEYEEYDNAFFDWFYENYDYEEEEDFEQYYYDWVEGNGKENFTQNGHQGIEDSRRQLGGKVNCGTDKYPETK